MCLHKSKPVRLEKKISLTQKIKNWLMKHSILLLIIFGIIATILIVILLLMFCPGTESGLWYNGGVESVVQ